jgi:cytochrome b subunit of formate dehydrogenase
VGSKLLTVDVVTCLVALAFTGLMLYTTPLTWCRAIPTQQTVFADTWTMFSFETLLFIGLNVTLYLFVADFKQT